VVIFVVKIQKYDQFLRWIACGSANGLVSLLDGETGNHSKTLEGHAMPVRALAFSPDSKLLLTGSDDKHIKIYAL